MPFSDLTSEQVQQLLVLLKQKESLEAQLSRIDATLIALESGNQEKSPAKIKKAKRGRRKGATLKVVILEALKTAGKTGLSVDALAVQTGRKKGSVAVWFYTVGKKIKEIKKLGRGRFAIG